MTKPDFHFTLAIIAIFGSAAGLSFQFDDARYEYENLSSSMAPLIRSNNKANNINAALKLQAELDDLEQQLQVLDSEQAEEL